MHVDVDDDTILLYYVLLPLTSNYAFTLAHTHTRARASAENRLRHMCLYSVYNTVPLLWRSFFSDSDIDKINQVSQVYQHNIYISTNLFKAHFSQVIPYSHQVNDYSLLQTCSRLTDCYRIPIRSSANSICTGNRNIFLDIAWHGSRLLPPSHVKQCLVYFQPITRWWNQINIILHAGSGRVLFRSDRLLSWHCRLYDAVSSQRADGHCHDAQRFLQVTDTSI